MRITQSMYYKGLYGTNNSQLQTRLFDVNKQIASGITIQYANENVAVFTETMRLDNEITTLEQIKKSTQAGFKISNQTDVVLSDFEETLVRMRTLLIQGSNDTNSATSLDALAAELRGKESHLKNLANTSINGKFLFSGSATDIKPISADGTYNGNDITMNSFLGSKSQQVYNLSGADLFLGEEPLIRREITSNMIQASNIGEEPLSESSTMENFMGKVPGSNQHNFYIRGTQNDGTTINDHIKLNNDNTVDDLLNAIGIVYGNTTENKVVNVSLNPNGQIVIADKLKGSSKLDFHMVGASDFDTTDHADLTNSIYGTSSTGKIEDLISIGNGTTNYDNALTSGTKLYLREFNKSGYTSATDAPSIEGLVYDRTMFSVSGNALASSISQIDKSTNAFATVSTKLSEVADLSQGTNGTLDGTQLIMKGDTINGAAYSLQIDLKNTSNGGTTYSLDGGTTNYNLFDVSTLRVAVDADSMTYKQLMDVINLAVTGSALPASTNDATDYDNAVKTSTSTGVTFLDSSGKITFNDLQFKATQSSLSLYDANSGSFTTGEASVMTFNANNALTIRDPKTDFFATIDEAITSLENHILYPNSDIGQRSIGMENSIKALDDIFNHVNRAHARVGANSNALTTSLERTEVLEISTKTLRSSIIDTDLAQAALTLTQLTLNYESMLATVGKISKLSLVNYL